jgi:hypothetical protein
MVKVLTPAKGTASTSDTWGFVAVRSYQSRLTNNLLFAKVSPGTRPIMWCCGYKDGKGEWEQ